MAVFTLAVTAASPAVSPALRRFSGLLEHAATPIRAAAARAVSRLRLFTIFLLFRCGGLLLQVLEVLGQRDWLVVAGLHRVEWPALLFLLLSHYAIPSRAPGGRPRPWRCHSVPG